MRWQIVGLWLGLACIVGFSAGSLSGIVSYAQESLKALGGTASGATSTVIEVTTSTSTENTAITKTQTSALHKESNHSGQPVVATVDAKVDQSVAKTMPETNVVSQAEPTTNIPVKKELGPPRMGQGVFTDSLVTGWSIDPSSVDATTVPSSDGKVALHIVYPGAWSHVYFSNTPGVDVSSSEGLRFNIRGEQPGSNIYVVLYDRNGDRLGAAGANDFIVSRVIPQDQSVESFIPLSVLGAENSIVGGIGIESVYPGTVDIDHLMFANSTTARPLSSLLSLQVPSIYSDTDNFQNGWGIATDGVNLNRVTVEDGGIYAHPLEFTFTKDQGSFTFQNDLALAPGKYNHLAFELKGDSNSIGSWLSVTLYDTQGVKLGSALVRNYMSNDHTDSYRPVIIPLSDLNADQSRVGKIEFSISGASDTVFDMDAITFEP